MEPTSFWVNPFGVAWPLLKASDLIRVDAEGKVVEGGPVRLLNTAGTSTFLSLRHRHNRANGHSVHDPPCSAYSPP